MKNNRVIFSHYFKEFYNKDKQLKITLEAKKSVLQKCEVNVKIPDSLADLTRLAKVEVDPVDKNQITLIYSVNKNREIK